LLEPIPYPPEETMHTQQTLVGAGAAVTLALVVMAGSAAAQSTPSSIQPGSMPNVIHACYVPNTGTIYRIKTEDTKQNCNSAKHIEFSWSQEGTLDHSELINLDQDDHLQYLLAEGVRESQGGFAVTGTFTGDGSPPVSGLGTRLMWFPEQAAFRVGRVEWPGGWDAANMGSYSVGMGRDPSARGEGSTAMGRFSTATGTGSTAIGNIVAAHGTGSTAMGSNNNAAGNYATAMGYSNVASGDFSTAMGSFASTNLQEGTFVYADRSAGAGGIVPVLFANAPNQFVVRAQRIWLGTNNNVTATAGRYLETSTGAFLSTGGTWTNASSRAAKENVRAVDPEEVLRKVTELEVPSWNYRSEEASVRHVGPFAQDFYRAFGLGGTDEAISTVDLGGINLLAVQALERRTTELRAENAALRSQNEELERRLARLEALPKR
jgi:trimeric autotransporter adhesin